MSSRALDPNEISRLVKKRPELSETELWPNQATIEAIADAVDHRRDIVLLTGKQFSIKYDDDTKAVFVRPDSNKEFAPCGWFSYEQLKDVLLNGG